MDVMKLLYIWSKKYLQACIVIASVIFLCACTSQPSYDLTDAMLRSPDLDYTEFSISGTIKPATTMNTDDMAVSIMIYPSNRIAPMDPIILSSFGPFELSNISAVANSSMSICAMLVELSAYNESIYKELSEQCQTITVPTDADNFIAVVFDFQPKSK